MKKIGNLSIIGGGSWATALAKIFSESEVKVTWYLRNPANVAHVLLHQRNPNYLNFLPLSLDHLTPTADLNAALTAADHLIVAVPAAYLSDVFSSVDAEQLQYKKIITAIKGMLPKVRITAFEYFLHRYHIPIAEQGVIGGPCHAEEIAMERKTYVTFSSKDESLAHALAASIQLPYIKTQANDDPQGVAYAAILKNVIGIACGIANRLHYGDNFQAVIVANATREMIHFLKTIDNMERDVSGAAYFGDLLVTAYSPHSRNRRFGEMIGQGYSVQAAQMQMNMVAEGYYAVDGIYHLANSLHIDMPVTSAVYRILYNGISPSLAFKLLEDKLT